jgi:hypothetical protein
MKALWEETGALFCPLSDDALVLSCREPCASTIVSKSGEPAEQGSLF